MFKLNTASLLKYRRMPDGVAKIVTSMYQTFYYFHFVHTAYYTVVDILTIDLDGRDHDLTQTIAMMVTCWCHHNLVFLYL